MSCIENRHVGVTEIYLHFECQLTNDEVSLYPSLLSLTLYAPSITVSNSTSSQIIQPAPTYEYNKWGRRPQLLYTPFTPQTARIVTSLDRSLVRLHMSMARARSNQFLLKALLRPVGSVRTPEIMSQLSAISADACNYTSYLRRHKVQSFVHDIEADNVYRHTIANRDVQLLRIGQGLYFRVTAGVRITFSIRALAPHSCCLERPNFSSTLR